MNKIKKHVWLSAAIAVCLLVFLVTSVVLSSNSNQSGDTRVIYSLDSRSNDQEIIKLIDQANKYAYFAVYYFTQRDIADALLRAKRRGLEVEGITDREGAQQAANGNIVKLLQSGGIHVETQKHLDGIMHMKVLVTDKAYASGSYNWTEAATEANDEVLEIGSDDKIRNEYLNIVKRVIKTNEPDGEGPTSEIQRIDYSEAPNHIGEYAEVSGMILKAYKSSSGTVFLDFCKASAKCPFSGVIFASDAGKFKDIDSLQGNVKISGVIRAYQGKAEMVVESPDQIGVNR